MSLSTLILCALLAPTSASDEVESRFRELVDTGLEAYEARRFDEAATWFLEAYALIPEPELVYNAARSYEKSLQRERAVEQYETFLTLEGTTARLRAKALDSMKLLRREIEALKETTPAPEPRAAPRDPPEAPSVAVAPPPRGPNRAVEISLLSAGGAALVASGVFGVLALRARSDFDDAQGADRIERRDEAERNALIADTLLISGGALAATGVILFLVRKGPRDEGVAWTPTLAPGGVGVAGRF